MELPSLVPEAFKKVEIQCHQNGDLKKQIHERQSRLAALNEKQKLAVRSCPAAVLVAGSAGGAGSSSSSSSSLAKQPGVPSVLLKAPGGGAGAGGGGGQGSSPPSLALSGLPAKGPVAMVTAHLNGGLGCSAEPPQSGPINLQTRLGCSARRAPSEPGGAHSQNLGTITAVPIKVPQVSSLQRLAGQRPAVLPQVRPKTLIPESLPISPCRDQPSKQPPTFQKATVVSIKNPTPALPTANNTVSHVQTPSSQSQTIIEPTAISPPLSSAGVAYAIITSPSNATSINNSAAVSVVNESIKVQPLLISADSKVIIIQPKVQSQTESKVEIKRPPEESVQGFPATKKKKEENPEKIAFMVALGLVTTEYLEEIQSKRQERKRRSTANPAYSGLLETERKRLASNYLNNPLFLSTRANEDPCWKVVTQQNVEKSKEGEYFHKNDVSHEHYCSACKRGANLQPCGTCPRAYHLNCLDPPLKTVPKGVWVCPKCQEKVLKKDENMPWAGTLAIVQSYVTHKTVKEERKRKLLRRNSELRGEHRQLEEKEHHLSNAMKVVAERRSTT